jgi:polyphosphate kinase 2 (PPK2 family)
MYIRVEQEQRKTAMANYQVGDRVKVVFQGMDIFGKTGVVTDAVLPNSASDYVLVKLDNPDRENVAQLGRISLREIWLTKVED